MGSLTPAFHVGCRIKALDGSIATITAVDTSHGQVTYYVDIKGWKHGKRGTVDEWMLFVTEVAFTVAARGSNEFRPTGMWRR